MFTGMACTRLAAAGCLALLAMSAGAAGLPPIVESAPADSEGAPPTLAPATPAPVAPAPAAPERPASPVRRPQSLEARVSRLERVLESQALVEILMRLDDLQRDVQSLRGSLEEQAHVMEGIKRRQRELYLDVDRRLRALEVKQTQASAAAPAAPAKGGSSAPAATAPPAVPPAAAQAPATASAQAPAQAPAAGTAVVDPLEEQAAYQQAFNLLKDGRYEEAIAAFQKFLVRYPKGQFADNAQYWLAEANYVLRRFPTAIEEFNKVLVNYPDSQKIADAMLKIGYCYYELKKWDRARKILEELVKRFPDSTAAQLARNRLHRMRLEGR